MTGNFTDWAGKIADIGAAYPFVGSEVFLVVLAFIFWIGWHLAQSKIEEHEIEDITEHPQS